MGLFHFLKKKNAKAKEEKNAKTTEKKNTQEMEIKLLYTIPEQPWRDWREDYLAKLGKLADADRPVQICVVRPDGMKVSLTLLGRQDMDEALNALKRMHFIRPYEYLTFKNWPRADFDAVGHFTRATACACEVEGMELSLVEYDPAEKLRESMLILYGCPNARTLENRKRSKTVEVLDYE